jgi:asparagine synthase (glutamine-hydrolysing)
MCGIAGIALFDPSATVDPERLRAMGDAIRHRGPDDEGVYVGGPVGLVSRRLSIVDVAGGHMPIANEDGTIRIVFNGEIYNHPQLRAQLERRGHRYRTRSDTETILHLYEDEGERCVERLQGMFAFAIWDSRMRRLLLARDRLGIKPLYYALAGGALTFGSEIKAVLASGRMVPRFNEAVLPEFLATRFVAGDETFFRDVRKLLPGRTLTWTPGGRIRERQYWTVPDAAAAPRHTPSLADAAAELRVRLGRAVQSHLMSDVPLGVFLSGGLDSSGLAALMAPLVRRPLRTFAVGFEEADANELAYARLVAGAVGAEHHETVVTPAQFFDALPRLVWHEDEPIAFPSSVPLYFVSRLAREHVKVVLTGEGADELFLGYNRYRVAAWNARLGAAYAALTPAALRDLLRRRVRTTRSCAATTPPAAACSTA